MSEEFVDQRHAAHDDANCDLREAGLMSAFMRKIPWIFDSRPESLFVDGQLIRCAVAFRLELCTVHKTYHRRNACEKAEAEYEKWSDLLDGRSLQSNDDRKWENKDHKVRNDIDGS